MTTSNFYKELLRDDDCYQEKTASHIDGFGEGSFLESFSTNELEALASELDTSIEKAANEETGSEREEYKNQLNEETAAKVNTNGNITDERDVVPSEAAAEDETKKEIKDHVEPQAATINNEVSSESDSSDSKEICAAEYDEGQLQKIAYEIVDEKLSENGYTLEDYVYSQIGNERIACEIAETAEKLAILSDNNRVKVADDILFSMNDIVGNLE